MFFFKLDIKKNLIILFVLRYALKRKIRQVQRKKKKKINYERNLSSFTCDLFSISTLVKNLISKAVGSSLKNPKYLEKYIRKAVLQYGKENLIIKPDCGFLTLRDSFGEKAGYEIATRKIKNMVLALNKIKH